ncbi:hypothetical protein QYF36_016693 [Acer negundo]|nr:hypothetical protein QYF36_016693 [Acer negundo]
MNFSTRQFVNALAGGSLMNKSMDARYDLIEDMSIANCHWGSDRKTPKKAPGMLDVDQVTAMQAQIDALIRQMNNMRASSTRNPFTSGPLEQVSFVNYNRNFNNQPRPQNNPNYFNTYNPFWRNHPNFSYKNNQNTLQPEANLKQLGFNQPQQAFPNQQAQFQNQAERKPTVEEMFSKYIGKLDARMETQDLALRKLDAKVDQLAQHSQAAIQNLEMQIGQLARGSQARQQRTLPSDTVINPKEQCKAISLRSRRTVEQPGEVGKKKEDIIKKEVVEEELVEKDKVEDNLSKMSCDPPPPPQVKAYMSPIPYPQRLRKHKDAHKFAKFLDVFKKLHINIPFVEALAQMPTYVKFLKDLLSNKRKLEEFEIVALTEKCSAILQNKLPPKLKDPGKFTIPCTIGNSEFSKALIDSGASINLMPYSVSKKLNVGEVKPTHITLQLADRSIKYPRGVMEDVLVKVDNLYFPVDFVILEMEEDVKIHLLLGRPFLKTACALINVKDEKMTLRVGDEQVVIDMSKATKRPSDEGDCFRVEVVEPMIQEYLRKENPKEPLEVCVVHGVIEEDEDLEVEECAKQLNSLPLRTLRGRFHFEKLGVRKPKLSPSIEKAPTLELKQLPSHLRYAFLGESSTLSVIISASLSKIE